MDDSPDVSAAGGERPLAGATAWLITDGKTGLDVQVRGVADALGLAYELKHVQPKGFWKLAGSLGLVSPMERFGLPGSRFAPPWPAVVIGAGMASLAYIRTLRRKAGLKTFTVVVQKAAPATADVVCAAEHDECRGPNVISTLTSPHTYSPARLAALRRELPPDIVALPHPRIAVILGGKNAVYKFTDRDDDRLQASLRSLGRLGASFLVTPSRRTHDRLCDVVEEATRDRPRIFWDGTGENPYPAFLAHADAFVVTADSVNMTGEACATGRPVYVFTPSEGSPKFRRFHQSLMAYGATRPLPERFDAITTWSYAPLDSANIIAREIERRYLRRRQMLSGLMMSQSEA